MTGRHCAILEASGTEVQAQFAKARDGDVWMRIGNLLNSPLVAHRNALHCAAPLLAHGQSPWHDATFQSLADVAQQRVGGRDRQAGDLN